MSDPTPTDSTLLVTLTVGQLRELLRSAPPRGSLDDPQERLLSAEEAAQLLCVSEDWLYRNAKKLSFTRKLGPKMLRFSYQGLLKWTASRKP